jgi:hypothetical protein
MSARQIKMLLIATLLPSAFGALVVLAIAGMAAALVPVNVTGILRLWPIFALVAGPAYAIFFWWLMGNWRQPSDQEPPLQE